MKDMNIQSITSNSFVSAGSKGSKESGESSVFGGSVGAEGTPPAERDRSVFSTNEFGVYVASHQGLSDSLSGVSDLSKISGLSALSDLSEPSNASTALDDIARIGGFADPAAEIAFLKARVCELEHELDGVSNKGKLIAQELDLFRQRRVVFWSDRFRNAFDAWNLMNANFQQLKDDSAIFHGGLQSLRLQPSLSLLRVPFLSYNFRLSRAGLCGVLLAPVLDVPLQVGELCVRLFSAPHSLLASCSMSVAEMSDEEPVIFRFDPIQYSDALELTMRVYVQGVDAPVRIFELRRYALGGFGKLQSRPFVGYLFS
jgi:hypothetical protein